MITLPVALAPFIAAARNIVARSHEYPERVMSTGGLGNPADLLATDFHRLALAYDAQEAAAQAKSAVDHETLVDHLTREIGDSYDCGRVWSAWSYGTMKEDDFEPLSDRIDEIAEGILALGSMPDRIPTFTSTDSWVHKARGLEVFTGPCPWPDCDRKTSAGRLVVHDGKVKVVVGIEAYAKVSEPREGEIIGLALAPYPPTPEPMSHRCATCGTKDGHALGCAENAPPEDPATDLVDDAIAYGMNAAAEAPQPVDYGKLIERAKALTGAPATNQAAEVALRAGDRVKFATGEAGEIIRCDYAVQLDEPDGSQGAMGGSVGIWTVEASELTRAALATQPATSQEAIEAGKVVLEGRGDGTYSEAEDAIRKLIAATPTPPAAEGLREALEASLAKRSVATMDPPYTAAFNAALDMVARDTALARAKVQQ